MSLREFAREYCQYIAFRFRYGIDYYQLLLALAFLAILCGIAFLANGRGGAAVNRFCHPWLYCILLICALCSIPSSAIK